MYCIRTHMNDGILRHASRDCGSRGVEIDSPEEEVVAPARVTHTLCALNECQYFVAVADWTVMISSPIRRIHCTAYDSCASIDVEQTQIFSSRTARLVFRPHVVEHLHPETVSLWIVNVAVVHRSLSSTLNVGLNKSIKLITLKGMRFKTFELPVTRSSSTSEKQPTLHQAGSLATVADRPRIVFLPT